MGVGIVVPMVLCPGVPWGWELWIHRAEHQDATGVGNWGSVGIGDWGHWGIQGSGSAGALGMEAGLAMGLDMKVL